MKISSISRASVALAGAAAMVVVGGGAAAGAQSFGSSADAETTEYGMNGWDTCPFEEILAFNEDGTAVPGPQSCITFVVREGNMQLGNIDVEFEPDSMKIAGGMNLVNQDWAPSEGSLYSNPVSVPGGAIGTGSAEAFGPTAITAYIEEVGTPIVDNSVFPDVTVDLPIRLKLSNPLLGDNCYIGTEDDPINIQLVADSETMGGIENPITGDDGNTYTGVNYPHVEASDTDFSIPGATGCGALGLGELNWAVNLRAGLPSEAGNNRISAKASFYVGQAWQIWNENL